MLRWLKPFLFSLCSLLALASCSDTGPVDFPPLSFNRYQPMYLNVSSIEVVEEYKSPQRPPYVEHLIPYSPADAMGIWVKDRLRAVGSDKQLQVIIKEGSVVVNQLKNDRSLKDLLTIDQDKRYDAKLEVELRIYGPESAISLASVSAKAHRSVTMSENASLNQRNVVFRNLITDMMDSVNAELEMNMYRYMADYINYSQNP